MEPVTGWTIIKTATDVSKKLYEIATGIKDYETKRKLEPVLDELFALKQQASDLEDENRSLREQLRFKSDDFEFKNPFYYEKKYPDRPLCPKCFASGVTAPMSEAYQGNGMWRRCLVCGNAEQTERAAPGHSRSASGGPWS